MIGLDTNILVRYITQDDLEQAPQASHFIEKHAHQKNSLFINNIVICELVWVLGRGYKFSVLEITKVLHYILSMEEFSFENQRILWESLKEYKNNTQDFSDILIGKINQLKHACKTTLTFDKKASCLKEFKSL